MVYVTLVDPDDVLTGPRLMNSKSFLAILSRGSDAVMEATMFSMVESMLSVLLLTVHVSLVHSDDVLINPGHSTHV